MKEQGAGLSLSGGGGDITDILHNTSNILVVSQWRRLIKYWKIFFLFLTSPKKLGAGLQISHK